MLPRPPTFRLTAETRSPLTETNARQTLSVHDCDGADREWVLESSVAKVSIFNSQNLTLHLRGRILTSTVEVFKCRNLRLVIGSSSASFLAEAAAVPLGTLQLDPPLDKVEIEYAAPRQVGKLILAPLASQNEAGRPTFGFTDLSVRASADTDATVLFDRDGALHFPPSDATPREGPTTIAPGRVAEGFDMARQLVVSHDDETGWRITGLERGEKDYPVLA
ncbi:hypothetical protein JCM3774_006334 [Rhodotorula dairenensis]